ncbi:MAG: SufD family Fe-S cluster assembly protein [Bacteroidales bacterium]|nr:SufD family Fe-S cluster assembly protein [Bacteroidales bacterium]
MDNRIYVIGRDCAPQHLRLDAGEKVSMTLVILPGTDAQLALEIDLAGPGASLDLAGLYLCPEAGQVDLRVLVRHAVGGCSSRQLFKGIVGGTARVCFDGLIYVAPDAQKTEAYQENHSLLLSDTARVESRPQLEIYADDVQCSHGATTGYLNPDELFYMRSRGIPEAQARHLQMQAFLAPVIRRLPDALAEEIHASLP